MRKYNRLDKTEKLETPTPFKAMLIVFVAAIECLNDIVVFMCGLFDIHDIRLETIFGVVFRPLVLLMG